MIGQTISHYRILEKIGEGGMGEVYLAEDTSLERKVALKFLPEYLQADPVAHKRFLREAKAAAAIEHPYICNIKEVARTEDGRDFIVMEYVEGQTLKDRLEEGRVPMKESLRLGAEVAEALEEAHNKGVIHRDLKPSNVMVTPSGHAKVMDFGLAKRIARDKEDLTAALTREGTTLGTLAYMSPEQTRGKKVDTRTDIFSLGVVLYEMLTGVHPFRTGTQAETVNAILSEHPSALSRYVQEVPDLLQHTVEKMLAKDPGERYQSVHEVRTNFTKVQEEITGPRPLLVAEKKTARRFGAVALVVVGIALIATWWHLTSQAPEPPGASMKITPLTADGGWKGSSSLSPDGEKVVYVWTGPNDDNYDIYVKDLGRGTHPLPLTKDPARDAYPVWSPDGKEIAFIRSKDQTRTIYWVPSSGGPPTKLVELGPLTEGRLTWSTDPDRNWLAFSEKRTEEEPFRIVRLSVETLEKEPLTDPPPDSAGDESPEFSPDGSQIVFSRKRSSIWGNEDIWVQPVDGGEARPVTHGRYYNCWATWMPNGKELLVTIDETQGAYRIMRLDLKGGELVPVLGLGENVSFVSVRGNCLVYKQMTPRMDNVWRIPGREAASSDWEAEELIVSSRIDGAQAFSSDGQKIAFASSRTGVFNIWTCGQDGSDLMQLTYFEAEAMAPSWSPNGKQIIFDSVQTGDREIYIVDAEGGISKNLTKHPSADGEPSFSRDGRRIYFFSTRGGNAQIWRMPVEGGEPSQITENGGFYGEESWDGEYLYYADRDYGGSIWRIPVDGGEAEEIVSGLHHYRGWALGRSRIYFNTFQSLGARHKVNTIWYRDLDTAQNKQLYSKEGPFEIQRLSVSPGEEWVLFDCFRQRDVDIMLVENFQ